MLIVSSYKYSLTPCPLYLESTLDQTSRTGFSVKLIRERACIREAAVNVLVFICFFFFKKAHGDLRTHGYTIPCCLGRFQWVRSHTPRCSRCRCSRRTRSPACARTWRKRGTSSAWAGSSGHCQPPSRARPGRRWTDTNRWWERERWSPSTVGTLTRFTRSSRRTGLRVSRTRNFRNCGWTHTTGRPKGYEGGLWGQWRSTGSARSSHCHAPFGTASRKRTVSR